MSEPIDASGKLTPEQIGSFGFEAAAKYRELGDGHDGEVPPIFGDRLEDYVDFDGLTP